MFSIRQRSNSLSWLVLIALPAGAAWAAGPHASAGTVKSPPPHLDLRPPELRSSTAWAGRETSAGSGAAEDRIESGLRPAFSSMAQGSRSMAVDFAQRFRREGLPLARLWENHAALVSLGLNPKGKPGLWLVQKTH